ncbi:IclR family transcriptional regulator [Antarctobacter heliothermus]|uniref:Transcriptional regulator, IclR family n=1 Tax=Antarctobacter heliothermus TaxID=74033 RepID=A0A239JF20_9RHOB|nr:IclR family transcriptional regulator [Antarctobacter heliothermus]SNT04202.1 transcriptional regulator, IclR family [Antarctobacter heliothermus]
MSSATKTLELLSFFSASRPEIGLSQLCRIAGRDKATTYRHLQALEYAGFVEKNPTTRHYRLGPAVLHLAQVREATVPRKAAVQLSLSQLADATGETAHVSVLSGTVVYSLASCESPRHGTRAVIDITTFPLHATATGICALAFGPADLFDVAAAHLDRFTANTPTTPQAVSNLVDNARTTGFGSSNGNYESEVYSLSAPLFDQTELFVGAVTVASVASRFTPDLERKIKRELAKASREITHNWGGTLPTGVEAAWAETLSPLHAMDTTS